jgi:hypothetical protein
MSIVAILRNLVQCIARAVHCVRDYHRALVLQLQREIDEWRNPPFGRA